MIRSDANEHPGAILTPEQRRYLLNFIRKDGAADRAFRYKIRQRMREGIYDLQLLFYHLSTSDFRTTFEDGHRSRDGPVPGFQPRDYHGMVGHGYEDNPGIPREGDLGSGFPGGMSVIGASIDNVIEKNPDPSKTAPGMQRALCDAVAAVCRASESGQIRPDRVLEEGYNKYLNRHKRMDYIAHVQKRPEGVVYTEACNEIRNSEYPQLNRAHRKAISCRGERSLEELVELYD